MWGNGGLCCLRAEPRCFAVDYTLKVFRLSNARFFQDGDGENSPEIDNFTFCRPLTYHMYASPLHPVVGPA